MYILFPKPPFPKPPFRMQKYTFSDMVAIFSLETKSGRPIRTGRRKLVQKNAPPQSKTRRSKDLYKIYVRFVSKKPSPISTVFILSHTDITDFVCLTANGSHLFITYVQFSNVPNRKKHLFFTLISCSRFGVHNSCAVNY